LESEVAIAHTRRQTLSNPNLVLQAPIQAQRMAVIVDTGESSFLLKLLAILAIAGVMLWCFARKRESS
jgi:hypothetical protein